MSGSVHLSFYEFGDFAFGMLIFRVLGCYYVALYLTFVLVWIYYCLYLFRTRAHSSLPFLLLLYGFTPRYVEGEITRKPCESVVGLVWYTLRRSVFGLHWSSSPDDDGTDGTNTTNDI